MFNRAEIIDSNFLTFVNDGKFPHAKSPIDIPGFRFRNHDLISIFESQVISRHIDLKARMLKEDGKCFYTIGSSGHEGNAVFGRVFSLNDIAFLHYRSTPFFIERSKLAHGATPIYDTALSFAASSEDPISGGRHKVIGSKKLNIPPQTSTIASHLPKAVGTAVSIDRAKDLSIQERNLKDGSIVLCSFGDASANHATALSAFNTASLIQHSGGHVPIVFICEDNGIGISVPTEESWIEKNFSQRNGIKYIKADGLNIIDLLHKTSLANEFSKTKRKPVFLHMKTVRLLGHAGSDIEVGYKALNEIEAIEFNDPLLHTARIMIDKKLLSKEDIISIYENSRMRVSQVFDQACTRPKLNNSKNVMKSITASNIKRKAPSLPDEAKRRGVFDKEYQRLNNKNHMAGLINYALSDILLRYSNTVVFGEDVGKKGGVYHITANLQKQFGARRVFDSPLDETSIIGFASGFGHNGFVTIPEIQFLAYFHNAEDQLRGEAATLQFFSNGQFTNPMVIRIPGLAYQKGFGGHFHNDNSLAIFRDIPGIILGVPSNGFAAVKMLRYAMRLAYEEKRIVIFIEPIALYMTKDLHSKNDLKWSFEYPLLDKEIALGEVIKYGNGKTLTVISYGNGLYLSLQAKKEIEKKINKKIQVIDLCWLSDIDIKNLLKLIGKCASVLIVDECRRSGCYGEGLMVDLQKASDAKLNIDIHAAENSFIPLGEGSTSTLPSKDSIIEAAIRMLNA